MVLKLWMMMNGVLAEAYLTGDNFEGSVKPEIQEASSIIDPRACWRVLRPQRVIYIIYDILNYSFYPSGAICAATEDLRSDLVRNPDSPPL